MRTAKLLAAATLAVSMVFPAFTLQAAAPNVTDIAFSDLDHDGRIERAVITIANPDRLTYAVTNVSNLHVSYDSKPLSVTSAYLITTDEPAKIALVWNEQDQNLPIDTSVGKFTIEWPDFAVTSAAPKSDHAAPMLVSSLPASGTRGVSRSQSIGLTFSEAVVQSSFAWQSQLDTTGWSPAWSVDGRTVTLSHGKYTASAAVTFTVSKALDAAGNALVPGARTAEPFHFNVSSSDFSNPSTEAVFAINEPAAGAKFTAGQPNVVAWYTNQPELTQVRLEWSVDGGATYRTIDTVPVGQKSYLWYPPNEPGSFAFKLKGLTANGAVVTLDTKNPLTLESGTGITIPGTEQHPPALPTSLPTNPTTPPPASNPNDKTAPTLVGSVLVDHFDAGAHTAWVSWMTDEPSTGSLIYGTLKDYGLTASDGNLATSHSVILTGLTPGSIHNLRLTTVDANSNAASTDDVIFSFYQDGDLVKATGPAVYWVKDSKRNVFPNGHIYATWFADFSSVIRIGDEQLAAIQLGTNVKVKGGTKLVKIQSDPKTYAVSDDGTLRWVQTEAQAKALYGADWNKKVIDLDVSLFSGYTIGDPL